MEKQILELIRKADRYPAKSCENLCKEIAELFREFTEWLVMCGYKIHSNHKYALWVSKKLQWFTLDELFTYWFDSIKDK